MKTTPEHNERFAKMTFAEVYPHYINKIERKGRKIKELDPITTSIISTCLASHRLVWNDFLYLTIGYDTIGKSDRTNPQQLIITTSESFQSVAGIVNKPIGHIRSKRIFCNTS
jgi:hypothetical protein